MQHKMATGRWRGRRRTLGLTATAFFAAAVLVFATGGLASGEPMPDYAPSEVGAGSAGAATQTDDRSPIDAAIRFRQNLGLRSDRPYVEQLDRDPASVRELGIATTPAELDHVNGVQSRAVAVLQELLPKLEKDSTFAGAWFDFPRETIDLATTGEPSRFTLVLSAYQQNGTKFRVRTVQYSSSELKALHEKVDSDADAWRARGVEFASVGIDVKANRLEIAVVGLSDTAKQLLMSEYGARVVITASDRPQFGACISRSNCADPIKGGLAAVDAYGNLCTSGFVFRDVPYAGAWYVSVAGHCIAKRGIGVSWYHNGTSFGTASSYVFYSGANVDNGFIVLPSVASPGNQLFASSTSDVRSMSSWYLNSGQTVGVSVCRAGNTSGYTCGLIDAIDQTIYVGGTLIYHMWRTDFTSAGGDSGGPMISGYSGLGVFSAYTGSPANSFYSTLEWIYDTQGKSICTSSGC